MFSYVTLERRVPEDHPLWRLRPLVDDLRASMDAEFEAAYSRTGRPSILPERLLRAPLLQILYIVRSEWLLIEQLDYKLLFRWFVGLQMDEAVWDRTVFSANRDWLLSTQMARAFFKRVRYLAEWQQLISNEHFSVDGRLAYWNVTLSHVPAKGQPLIEAWAGHESFVRKDGGGPRGEGSARNPEVDFSGEPRSNATHQSTTDPESRLYKKGTYVEAKLRYLTHALSEHRKGLIVDVETTQADGRAEWVAAQRMIRRSTRKPGATVAGDKGYDTEAFVGFLRQQGLKTHIARKKTGSASNGRAARGKAYGLNLNRRKRIEEAVGWIKTAGGLRKTRHKGVERIQGQALLTFSAYNLVRMLNLLQPQMIRA